MADTLCCCLGSFGASQTPNLQLCNESNADGQLLPQGPVWPQDCGDKARLWPDYSYFLLRCFMGLFHLSRRQGPPPVPTSVSCHHLIFILRHQIGESCGRAAGRHLHPTAENFCGSKELSSLLSFTIAFFLPSLINPEIKSAHVLVRTFEITKMDKKTIKAVYLMNNKTEKNALGKEEVLNISFFYIFKSRLKAICICFVPNANWQLNL